MSKIKHVVLTNDRLNGPEYGVLRDFEDEIVRITGASRTTAPQRELPDFFSRRVAHGTRYERLRQWIPKARHRIEADVLWVVLMGPENYSLDLFREWDQGVGTKILYLFDTFEVHTPMIRRMLRSVKWDIAITSFSGAQKFLEQDTQRKWFVVPQGVKLNRFSPPAESEKNIDFCAYGRRLNPIHQNIKTFCLNSGKYYDYTIAATFQAQLDPRDNYDIYSWHLNQSLFNFCWPVELTHPQRVSSFSPITCRWFEAAASGNTILGQSPQDSGFDEMFGPNLVVPIDPTLPEEHLAATWETLWENRKQHLESACKRRDIYSDRWSWESRVRQILTLLESH